MEWESVRLKLPNHMLRQAQLVATAQDVTIGHLVRQLLQKEIDRRTGAKRSKRTDERLLAALQALLARDMAEAQNWQDLEARLARHGYEMRPAGGGLTLHKRSCGTRVCKASELGFAYRTLVKRFACAMPGHPHGTLGLIFAEEEDFDLIEPF